jgi:hypothetical protein
LFVFRYLEKEAGSVDYRNTQRLMLKTAVE